MTDLKLLDARFASRIVMAVSFALVTAVVLGLISP